MKRNIDGILILVLLVTLNTSCGLILPKHLKSSFSGLYDKSNTGIDSLIKINGYYTIGQTFDKYGQNVYSKHEIDTFYINLMFFPDGLLAYNFIYYPNIDSSNYAEYLKMDRRIATRKFSNPYAWGIYSFSYDTIRIKYIHRSGPFQNNLLAREDWFLVIDSTTLQFIESRNLEKTNSTEKIIYAKATEKMIKTTLTAKFITTSDNFDPECWLIRKKWFWKKETNNK